MIKTQAEVQREYRSRVTHERASNKAIIQEAAHMIRAFTTEHANRTNQFQCSCSMCARARRWATKAK